MKPYLLNLLFVLVLFKVTAQTQQPVFDLIRFDNELEQQEFQKLSEADTNLLNLLLVADGRADSMRLVDDAATLEQVYSELDSSRLVRKKPKKLIAAVFEKVHDRLLRKYEFQNQFAEIFETGNYNCVSATAIYSYMLHGLGVPHAIVQTPDHVYAIAFYKDETWVMESTDPQQGYYEVTDKSREESLDQLVAQKIITPEQRNSPQLDSILNDLFPEEGISSNKLVSIQYSNQGAYDLNREMYFEAFQQYARAYVIYPDSFNLAGLNMSLAFWLDEEDFDHELFLPGQRHLVRQSKTDDDFQRAFDVFKYYGNLYLEEKISDSLFDQLGTIYSGASVDTTWRNKFVAYHNNYKAQRLLMGRKGVEAYPFAREAVLHFSDVESRRLLVGAISIMAFYQTAPVESLLDSIRILDKQVPSLRENELWVPVYMEFVSQQAFTKILQNDFRAARQLLDEFESNASAEVVSVMDKTNIEKVYGRLISDYYKTDKRQAARLLKNGLALMPDSEILKYYETKLRF